MEAIKPILLSPVQSDGKRYLIHWQTEAGQVLMRGLKGFPALGLSESDTALSAIEKLAQVAEESRMQFCVSITIPADGWMTSEASGEYGYYLDIHNENISENRAPFLVFSPENAAYAATYGICESCESMTEKIRVYSMAIPEREIPATLYLIGADSGIPGSELPIASKTRAGVVKVGDNLDVTEDGTISVPALSDENSNGVLDAVENSMATESEVKTALDKVGL